MALTNKVTVDTYQLDRLYPKVVSATTKILAESDEISPVAILMQMGNLTPTDYEAWRRSDVRYLEKVFQGSLSKANHILRIIGFHMHDLNMIPAEGTYRQKGKKTPLRFSKNGFPNIERRYRRHYRWNQSPEKKQAVVQQGLLEKRT